MKKRNRSEKKKPLGFVANNDVRTEATQEPTLVKSCQQDKTTLFVINKTRREERTETRKNSSEELVVGRRRL
jgi:hypothetical protein